MQTKLSYKSVSEIGVKEKYIRLNHYNTIKTWWARRPITTSRALLIDEILIRHNEQDKLVSEQLLKDVNPSKKEFNSFRDKYKTGTMSVLDVFSGGGSIPFESSRLGFKTYSSELNPVANIIQETIFNSVLIKNFPDTLRRHGNIIINNVEKKLSKYFNVGAIKPYVIFYSKIATCKNCHEDLDLRRIEFLCKKKNKSISILAELDELKLSSDAKEAQRSSKDFICQKCNTVHNFKDLKGFCKDSKFKHQPFAYCYISKGKRYKIITETEKEILESYNTEIALLIEDLKWLLPTGYVKSKSGVINPTIYDLKKHQDFFSQRQLLVLLTLINETIREYRSFKSLYSGQESKQLVLGLTSLIEFLCDWNSVSTMWIPQNEQTGRSLAGPGVGMKWDFIEINPFSATGSNFKSKLERVCSTLSCLNLDGKIDIIKGSSANLPIEDKSIDIVLTDPPYYDSIDYTGLSEFFRPWFEVLIRNTYDNNIDLRNKSDLEAIVELSSKESSKDHNHYKNIMTQILNEVHRVLKDNGSCLLMYSHKTMEGWDVISEAFKKSNLIIDECVPLEMERIARPRAMSHEALNGVIVFKAKKSFDKVTSVYSDILNIKNKIRTGDLLESQIVIYLAALACKEVTLTDKAFKECYEHVTRIYQINNFEEKYKSDFDEITLAYLEAKLCIDLKDLNGENFNVLRNNDLIVNSKLLEINDIPITDKIDGTILKKCILVFNSHIYNSKTKLLFNELDFNKISMFFSTLSGTQLNTVSKRSSNLEVKTSRLILSKLSSSVNTNQQLALL